MRIERSADPDQRGGFLLPDGSRHRTWYTAQNLPSLLAAAREGRLTPVTINGQPARPGTPGAGPTGERMDVHACVQALFDLRPPDREVATAA